MGRMLNLMWLKPKHVCVPFSLLKCFFAYTTWFPLDFMRPNPANTACSVFHAVLFEASAQEGCLCSDSRPLSFHNVCLHLHFHFFSSTLKLPPAQCLSSFFLVHSLFLPASTPSDPWSHCYFQPSFLISWRPWPSGTSAHADTPQSLSVPNIPGTYIYTPRHVL